MNEDILIKKLQASGINATSNGSTIIVKLGGFSNPVSIVEDEKTQRYKLNSHEIPILLISSLSLLSVIKSGTLPSDVSGTVAFLFALLGFFLVLMTELKATSVREIIASHNREL